MKTRLWFAGSVIAAWQLLSSPQFPWTPSAPLILLACGVGTVVCIFALPWLVRLEADSETLILMAFIIYLPVYHMAQHPVQFMEPRYVAVSLGNDKQSRVYPIGSMESKNIEPTRKDDWYRELHYFAYWQTAKVAGFEPSRKDIPQAKDFPIAAVLIAAAIERAVGIFPYWVLLTALLGIYFFFDARRAKQKKHFSYRN
jgi:hypothetical protein